MDYEILVANLRKVDTEGNLYSNFFSTANQYYASTARAQGYTRIEQSATRTHFEQESIYKFGELVKATEAINSAFSAHVPPITPLPVSKKELSDLVSGLLQEVFNNRKR